MEISITEKEIKEIKKFINSGELVQNMNDYELSYNSMALVLHTLIEKCDEITDFLKGKE